VFTNVPYTMVSANSSNGVSDTTIRVLEPPAELRMLYQLRINPLPDLQA